MRQVEAEQRSATPDEQAVLARWSGWGAVPQVFDRDEFASEREELQALLSSEEYAAARRSTQNAHFTDYALVTAMWSGLQQLGFSGGPVLEPGCGSGTFLGTAPAEAQMVGVERDAVSAGIARLLYPHAQVLSGSFADFQGGESQFAAAIGNVPFSQVALYDPQHNPNGHSLHNHFIIKALHQVEPGGMVAVLTSRYTLDAQDMGARDEIAEQADLVDAVRLPSRAHRRAAGTDVVTDLVILQRRVPDSAPRVPVQSWREARLQKVDGADEPLAINQYFVDNPHRVLGEFAAEDGLHRQDLTVEGDLNRLGEQLSSTLADVAEAARQRGQIMPDRQRHATENAVTPSVIPQVAMRDPDAAAYEGFITAHEDGTFTRLIHGTEEPFQPPAKEARELRQLLRLRDLAMGLVRAEQRSTETTAEMNQLRQQLNSAYTQYADTYGPVNRFRERRQMRPVKQVFGQWCDRNDLDKHPATPQMVSDYLTELREQGLGQDQLSRHLDGIAKDHDQAFHRQAKKAAIYLVKQRSPQASKKELSEAAAEYLDRPATAIAQARDLGANVQDLRLSDLARDAAQRVVDAAPAKTPADVDFDELDLRTTAVIRPNQGGFRHDPFSNVVRALEKFDPTTQHAERENIFFERVILPRHDPDYAETAEEALSICLDRHSQVDLDEIARLRQLPDAEAARADLGELIYTDPANGQAVWAREYLAGNVRRKLAQARQAAETDPAFAVNVAALEQVTPPDRGPSDIEIQMGSWIRAEYVQQFLAEQLGDPNVRVEHTAGVWAVTTTGGNTQSLAATELWGTPDCNAYQLAEHLLIGSEIRVTRTVEDISSDGEPRERQVFAPEATEAAKDKAAALANRFSSWVWEDTNRAQELVEEYNRRFNAEIPPDFSGVELSLPGLSEQYTLYEHQKAAVARIIYQPSTGLVHDVGAGKTLEMIVGTMERRRRGLSRSPVVVVPNDSIAEQFEREWLRAYPQARVLTGTSSELADTKGRDGRAAFVARATTGDWDALIMTKESFQRLPLPPDEQEAFLVEELERVREVKESQTEDSSQTMIKRLERAMEAAEERLNQRLAEIDRDAAGLSIVDINPDLIVIDEAHNYKNGLVTSAIPDLGIPGSDRALDLDMKLEWQQRRFGEPRVVLATATPFTNRITEAYLWQRRLGHDLPPFDEWARTYCTTSTTTEPSPGGTLKSRTRMRGVLNEPELWRSLRLTSDFKMKEELGLKLPTLRGDAAQVLTATAPTEARIATLDLARRERTIPSQPGQGQDNHLVINHEAQLVGLDVRAVGLDTDEPQKLDVVADDLAAEWHGTRDLVYYQPDGSPHPVTGGAFLVFCDDAVPKRGRSWNAYDEFRELLVERGLPRDEIRFLHEAPTAQRRADLLASCREGAVTVLMGSTEKMGAGLNVQTRMLGGYELTGHYLPHVSPQARGRIERQGNQNTEIFWKLAVTAPSGDAKKYTIAEQRRAMFDPLYRGEEPARHREVTDEDPGGQAEAMVSATGDQRYREKRNLDDEHDALMREYRAHQRSQQHFQYTITEAPERIERLDALITRIDEHAQAHVSTRGDAFRITLDGQTYTKRPEAAGVLKDQVTAAVAATPRYDRRTVDLGSMGGFRLAAEIAPNRVKDVWLRFPDLAEDVPDTSVPLESKNLPGGHGIITRLENQLDEVHAAGEPVRQRRAEAEHDLSTAQANLGTPFPAEQRLAEVTARRQELVAELSLDDDSAPPDEDPNSPEAQARRERREARAREREELRHAAKDYAIRQGQTDEAGRFAEWYVAIIGPVVADYYPSFDKSLPVWVSLGKPGAVGRGEARARSIAVTTTAERADNAPEQQGTVNSPQDVAEKGLAQDADSVGVPRSDSAQEPPDAETTPTQDDQRNHAGTAGRGPGVAVDRAAEAPFGRVSEDPHNREATRAPSAYGPSQEPSSANSNPDSADERRQQHTPADHDVRSRTDQGPASHDRGPAHTGMGDAPAEAVEEDDDNAARANQSASNDPDRDSAPETIEDAVSKILAEHAVSLSETDQNALVQHLQAQLGEPTMAQRARVNALDNYTESFFSSHSEPLVERFIDAADEPVFGESPELIRIFVNDSHTQLRTALTTWFAQYSHRVLNGDAAVSDGNTTEQSNHDSDRSLVTDQAQPVPSAPREEDQASQRAWTKQPDHSDDGTERTVPQQPADDLETSTSTAVDETASGTEAASKYQRQTGEHADAAATTASVEGGSSTGAADTEQSSVGGPLQQQTTSSTGAERTGGQSWRTRWSPRPLVDARRLQAVLDTAREHTVADLTTAQGTVLGRWDSLSGYVSSETQVGAPVWWRGLRVQITQMNEGGRYWASLTPGEDVNNSIGMHLDAHWLDPRWGTQAFREGLQRWLNTVPEQIDDAQAGNATEQGSALQPESADTSSPANEPLAPAETTDDTSQQAPDEVSAAVGTFQNLRLIPRNSGYAPPLDDQIDHLSLNVTRALPNEARAALGSVRRLFRTGDESVTPAEQATTLTINNGDQDLAAVSQYLDELADVLDAAAWPGQTLRDMAAQVREITADPAGLAVLRADALYSRLSADDISRVRDPWPRRNELVRVLMPPYGGPVDEHAARILIEQIYGSSAFTLDPDQRSRAEIAQGRGAETAYGLAGLTHATRERAAEDSELGRLLRDLDLSDAVQRCDEIADRLAEHVDVTLPERPRGRLPDNESALSDGQAVDDAGPISAATDGNQDNEREQSSAAESPTTGIVITHGRSGTTVSGTDKDDGAVYEVLRGNKFRWSRNQGFWYLPRPWRVETRAVSVRRLTDDLDRLNRSYTRHDPDEDVAETSELPDPVSELSTDAEPFTAPAQLRAAAEPAFAAFHQASQTAAGRRLLSDVDGSALPEGRALRETSRRVQRRPETFEQGLTLFATWAQHARLFSEALDRERVRAPKLREHIHDLVHNTHRLASRLQATGTLTPGAPADAPGEPATQEATEQEATEGSEAALASQSDKSQTDRADSPPTEDTEDSVDAEARPQPADFPDSSAQSTASDGALAAEPAAVGEDAAESEAQPGLFDVAPTGPRRFPGIPSVKHLADALRANLPEQAPPSGITQTPPTGMNGLFARIESALPAQARQLVPAVNLVHDLHVRHTQLRPWQRGMDTYRNSDLRPAELEHRIRMVEAIGVLVDEHGMADEPTVRGRDWGRVPGETLREAIAGYVAGARNEPEPSTTSTAADVVPQPQNTNDEADVAANSGNEATISTPADTTQPAADPKRTGGTSEAERSAEKQEGVDSSNQQDGGTPEATPARNDLPDDAVASTRPVPALLQADLNEAHYDQRRALERARTRDQFPAMPDRPASLWLPAIPLSRLREWAESYDLQFDIVHAGGRAFVTLTEPGASTMPVVSAEAGVDHVVVAGSLSVEPADLTQQLLARYREAFPRSWFTAVSAVEDGPRRLAQLVAPALSETEPSRQFYERLRHAVSEETPGEIASALYSVEQTVDPLVPSPERFAVLAQALADHGPRYAQAPLSSGDPGRYVIEGHLAKRSEGISWREKELVYALADQLRDQLLQDTPAEIGIEQRRQDATYDAAEQQAQRWVDEARSAYSRGDSEHLAKLLDAVEMVAPWHHETIAESRAALEPASQNTQMSAAAVDEPSSPTRGSEAATDDEPDREPAGSADDHIPESAPPAGEEHTAHTPEAVEPAETPSPAESPSAPGREDGNDDQSLPSVQPAQAVPAEEQRGAAGDQPGVFETDVPPNGPAQTPSPRESAPAPEPEPVLDSAEPGDSSAEADTAGDGQSLGETVELGRIATDPPQNDDTAAQARDATADADPPNSSSSSETPEQSSSSPAGDGEGELPAADVETQASVTRTEQELHPAPVDGGTTTAGGDQPVENAANQSGTTAESAEGQATPDTSASRPDGGGEQTGPPKEAESARSSVLPPAAVETYLRTRGWQQRGQAEHGTRVFARSTAGGSSHELLLPSDHMQSDAADLVDDAVSILESIEQRDSGEIIAAIQALAVETDTGAPPAPTSSGETSTSHREDGPALASAVSGADVEPVHEVGSSPSPIESAEDLATPVNQSATVPTGDNTTTGPSANAAASEPPPPEPAAQVTAPRREQDSATSRADQGITEEQAPNATGTGGGEDPGPAKEAAGMTSSAEPTHTAAQAPDPEKRRDAVNQAAAAWFSAQLDTPAAQTVRETELDDRLGGAQAVEQLRQQFTIGYAPSGWDNLVTHLRQQGYSDDEQAAAGVARRASNGRLIDRFRARLTFGIYDQQGDLVGFTARDTSGQHRVDERCPKYLNTPETDLFRKSEVLFGSYEQQAQIPHGDLVITEGPFDALAIAAANNTAEQGSTPVTAVAACGTAVTDAHMDLLGSVLAPDQSPILALDHDQNGKSREVATLEKLLDRFPHPRGTHFPADKDRDDAAGWIRNTPERPLEVFHDPAYTEHALARRVQAVLSQWNALFGEPQSVDARINAAQAVAKTLAQYAPDGPHQHEWQRQVVETGTRLLILSQDENPATVMLGYVLDERDGRKPPPTDPASTAPAHEASAPHTTDPAPAPASGDPDPAASLEGHDRTQPATPAEAGATPSTTTSPLEPDPGQAPQEPATVHHSRKHGTVLLNTGRSALNFARLSGYQLGVWRWDPTMAQPNGTTGAWRIPGTEGRLLPEQAVPALHTTVAALQADGLNARLDVADSEATDEAQHRLTYSPVSQESARADMTQAAQARLARDWVARPVSHHEHAELDSPQRTVLHTGENHNTRVEIVDIDGRAVVRASGERRGHTVELQASFVSHERAQGVADRVLADGFTLADFARRATTMGQARAAIDGTALQPNLTPNQLRSMLSDRSATSARTQGTTRGQANSAMGKALGGGKPARSNGQKQSRTAPARPATTPPQSTPTASPTVGLQNTTQQRPTTGR